MEVLILDDSLRRVPVGVQGTIYACGNQLSLGYLDRPELTKQLFVANPHSRGELMYNTGWFHDAFVFCMWLIRAR
jgi:non-ribosomal peptide synthetase component F